jgi:hypothetical protein
MALPAAVANLLLFHVARDPDAALGSFIPDSLDQPLRGQGGFAATPPAILQLCD